MSANPSIIPIEGSNPTQSTALPAPLPPGLPASGVFDSLFSGLPGGTFIGRYWWILLLVFFLFIKPAAGTGSLRLPLGGGLLWILILLFFLYPKLFPVLNTKR